MFKIGSFEQEICESMEKTLVSNQLETNHGFSKLAKAADFLNAAATIFEKAGMQAEANEINKVLEDLANQMADK